MSLCHLATAQKYLPSKKWMVWSSTWLRGFIGAPCLIQVSKHRGCCESSGAFQRCPVASVGVLALCHCRVRKPWSVWRHLSGSSSKRINTNRLRFTSVALPWHHSLDLFGSINCTNNSSDRHFFLSSIWAAFFFRTLMPLQQLGIWKTTEFVYNLHTVYRKI